MGDRIAPTLDGQGLWAFRKLQRLLGKNESQTAQWIIDRWIVVDTEFVQKHGLGLEDYAREVGGIVPFPEPREKDPSARREKTRRS